MEKILFSKAVTADPWLGTGSELSSCQRGTICTAFPSSPGDTGFAWRQMNREITTTRATSNIPINTVQEGVNPAFLGRSARAPVPVLRLPSPGLTVMPSPSGDVIGSTKPALTAYIAASVREATPILAKILRKWTFTVLELIYKSRAISLLLAPVATKCRISRSRSLNSLISGMKRSGSFVTANAQTKSHHQSRISSSKFDMRDGKQNLPCSSPVDYNIGQSRALSLSEKKRFPLTGRSDRFIIIPEHIILDPIYLVIKRRCPCQSKR